MRKFIVIIFNKRSIDNVFSKKNGTKFEVSGSFIVLKETSTSPIPEEIAIASVKLSETLEADPCIRRFAREYDTSYATL